MRKKGIVKSEKIICCKNYTSIKIFLLLIFIIAVKNLYIAWISSHCQVE